MSSKIIFSPFITELVVSSSAKKRGQITEGARAVAKKAGHAMSGDYKSAFEHIDATQENAEALIRNIMKKPSRIFVGHKVIDVYDAADHGLRFEKETGKFMGFLEGRLTE